MKDFDLKENKPLTIDVEDAAVWKSFRNGDERALTFIFNNNFDSLYLYGLKLAEDPETVKDAIQNLFLQLWHNRQNLSNVDAIRPYLLKALRNHILISIKQVKVQDELKSTLGYTEELGFSPEDIFINQQTDQKKSQAIMTVMATKLTKRQREVITLKFYEGLSYEKVAEIMELNVQSVRNLIYQAIKILKENLLFLLIMMWWLF